MKMIQWIANYILKNRIAFSKLMTECTSHQIISDKLACSIQLTSFLGHNVTRVKQSNNRNNKNMQPCSRKTLFSQLVLSVQIMAYSLLARDTIYMNVCRCAYMWKISMEGCLFQCKQLHSIFCNANNVCCIYSLTFPLQQSAFI